MHVLSKLFVALVALLTAALVPMVVTYAYNEDSYKAKWQESRAEVAALQGRLDAQSGEFDAVKTGLSTRAAELEASFEQPGMMPLILRRPWNGCEMTFLKPTA